MMNQLVKIKSEGDYGNRKGMQIFTSAEFGEIRMVMVGGNPHAIGSDVAKACEYAIPHKAVRDHCKGVLTWNILTNGGNQQVLIIPEGDIIRLIVKAADQSKSPDIKAKAERLERLIFDEILPTIMRTGRYALPGAADKESAYLINARTRQARLAQQMAKDFQNIICPESLQILIAEAAQTLFGRPVLPMPQMEVHFTATEIAVELNSSANQVGRIAIQNHLKTTEHGKWILDKAKGQDKQVRTFLYNDKGKQAVGEIFRKGRLGVCE